MKIHRLIAATLVVGLTVGLTSACGSGDSETSGRSNTPGLAGSDGGTTTSGGTTGGGTTGGSCNPQFCPSTGAGTPCCVTANGPCGLDTGTGCISDGPGSTDAG